MLSDSNKFLEHAFSALNKVYFNGTLPEVVITIQSSRNTYGHVTLNEIWEGNCGSYRELNISAEFLNRPIGDIISTLLHECCHLYAMENGIQDVSNNGRYHNKNFKRIAEGRDLKISYQKYIGWSVTEPTEGLLNMIKEYGLDRDLGYVRLSTGWDSASGGDNDPGGNGGKTKKKTSTRKYTCPTCNCSVRATKDVNIACLDCGERMVKVE